MLDHLPEMVVKETHGAGGYGMLVGPASTKAEKFRAVLKEKPNQYIDQPTLVLSTCPTYVESGIALREGSLVVNSSQGGGTKDTWILES